MEQCEQPVEVEFEQALGFVQAVKQALSPSAYTAFLDVLRAYREDRCVAHSPRVPHTAAQRPRPARNGGVGAATGHKGYPITAWC